ncbi:LuxR family transcriptional regulator [Brevundimonas naejangsanensis]|uniref:LuxR family transcriptional regulator n=1 Tax=Brevundimonas naejangsanensis TaxID=588932 RepID=A0A494RKV2_9CAUL|nr:helix-turn-helix transcriptional regulator [Brevundimonas naejangsanensis]AYG94366.1 LuxR family transcriptional regulator [Brevundimonas naejangsanensis]
MEQAFWQTGRARRRAGEEAWVAPDRRTNPDRRRPPSGSPDDADGQCNRALAAWIDGEMRARLLVTRALDVVWMNEAARILREDGELFGVEGGRFAPQSRVLARLAAQARPGEARCLAAPGADGRTWVVWAREVATSPTSLIGLTLQRSGGEVRFQALIETHLLSPSEGRIVEMLLAGMETGRIAQTMDVSLETVRSHLKRAYQKMGVRSRGELFAQALAFVGP